MSKAGQLSDPVGEDREVVEGLRGRGCQNLRQTGENMVRLTYVGLHVIGLERHIRCYVKGTRVVLVRWLRWQISDGESRDLVPAL